MKFLCIEKKDNLSPKLSWLLDLNHDLKKRNAVDFWCNHGDDTMSSKLTVIYLYGVIFQWCKFGAEKLCERFSQDCNRAYLGRSGSSYCVRPKCFWPLSHGCWMNFAGQIRKCLQYWYNFLMQKLHLKLLSFLLASVFVFNFCLIGLKLKVLLQEALSYYYRNINVNTELFK